MSNIKKFIKFRMSEIAPKLKTKIAYRNAFMKKLDLKNPKTLNEKMLYLKLYDFNNNEVITQCVDKYKVRDYLINKGYQDLLPKLYGKYDSVKEINFEDLPRSFVIKCNHGCGYNVIVKDKKDLNIDETKKKIDSWMKEDYWKYGAEVQYKHVKKKIIIEEYLGNVETYKFYCFNGIPKMMYISNNLVNDDKFVLDYYIDFFDKDFNHIECTLGEHPNYTGKIDKPQNFDKMIELASKLSREFKFVRIDLYSIEDRIYFSEFTFVPTAGFMKINPPSLLDEWGSWLDLD